MQKKRYSVAQIVAAIQQNDARMSVAEISRKLVITEQIFYRRKKEYGGLGPSQVRDLKQLRGENLRLKKLVADLSRDKAMLQDINSREW